MNPQIQERPNLFNWTEMLFALAQIAEAEWMQTNDERWRVAGEASYRASLAVLTTVLETPPERA